MELPMQLKVKLVLCKQEQVNIFHFLTDMSKLKSARESHFLFTALILKI